MKKRKKKRRTRLGRPRKGPLPVVVIPTIHIPQPDGGLLIKAGKPEVVGDVVGTSEAARLTHMSSRWIIRRCVEGGFRTAFKPGDKLCSHWRIARAEVLAFIERRRQTVVE